MRPLRFPQMAPNTGLSIGAGLAGGLNQALNNVAKLRMQQAHMKALQMQAQGMNAYRQAQADSLRQKSMSADMAKLDMLTSASKTGQYNPAAIKKFESQYMGSVLEKMTPDEAKAAQQHFDALADKGQIADEFQPAAGLNPAEAKIYGQKMTADSGVQRAQIAGDTRLGAAQTYADSRENVATSQANARLGAAGIYAGARSANDPNKVAYSKDLELRNHLTNQLYSSNMGIPLTDEAKAGIRGEIDQVNQRIAGYHSPKSAGAPGAQAAPITQPAPAAPATPRTLQHDQWQQAQPGDTVIHQDGTAYKALGGGNFAPAPAPPQAAPAQSLPPVPAAAVSPNSIGGGQ